MWRWYHCDYNCDCSFYFFHSFADRPATENAWAKGRPHVEGGAHRGRGGQGRGGHAPRGGGRQKPHKPLPQSVDEMPKIDDLEPEKKVHSM